ncbi:MAG: RdgB/HAM1 family non-canonical purine NTP pyrophosphatase [Cytophagales bacterium]|nr:RdgB/HAM1 family non-canonical purine NTP pyrophosphatase [Cytophagales bacterium]
METLIIATHNAGKAAEINRLLEGKYEVKSLKDLGYHEEIVEDGDSFKANALIKARTIFEKFGKPCFADDSGLEVDALDGAPGVYSARFAGEPSDDTANNQLLLEKLEGNSDRHAQFRTVIAYIDGGGKEQFFTGIARGSLLTSLTGDQGFGYDPLFLPEGETRTFAQMSKDEKNRISHRGIAINHLISYLANQ